MRPIILLLALFVPVATATAEPTVLEFEGRIEAAERALVYSRAEGRVAEVLVAPGQYVSAGDILVRLEADLAQLEVAKARAELDFKAALLEQARAQFERAERLEQSGSGSEVGLFDAQIAHRLAKAEWEIATAAHDRTLSELRDTEIRAPLSGYVERQTVLPGSLIEFDAGLPPLFEIVQLDPVRLIYEVPYSQRLERLSETGSESAETLFDSVRLDLAMSDGRILAQGLQPQGTSVGLQSSRGTLTVWAEVPNPRRLLRPGLAITVKSHMSSPENKE